MPNVFSTNRALGSCVIDSHKIYFYAGKFNLCKSKLSRTLAIVILVRSPQRSTVWDNQDFGLAILANNGAREGLQ